MSHRDQIITTYNQMAPGYDATTKSSKYAIPDWLKRQIPAEFRAGELHVTDVGCGSGNLGQLIHDLNPKVALTGLDISPGMCAEAGKKGIYKKLYTHDLERPLTPLGLTKADLIIAFGVFEFVSRLPKLVDELGALIKPGGTLMCSFQEFDSADPNKPKTMTNKSGFVHTAYNRQELTSLLNHAGFQIQVIDQVIGYISPTSGWACPYLLIRAQKERG